MPPSDSAAGLCTKAVWTRVRGVHRALPSGFAVLQQDLMLLALKQFLWDRLSFCFSYFGCFVFISLSYIYIYICILMAGLQEIYQLSLGVFSNSAKLVVFSFNACRHCY